MAGYHTLRLILGDQLNHQHSWFSQPEDGVLYVIAELHQETGYVKHHVQKVCAFFAAMQHFARRLEQQGHHVLSLTLDDTARWPDLPTMLVALAREHRVSQIDYQRPDEFRLREQLQQFSLPAGMTRQEWDTEHFLLPFDELDDWFPVGRHLRMETFYRRMRRHFNVLMEDDQPLGGRWNFDSENRQKLQADDLPQIPQPLLFANEVGEILKRLARHHIDTLGSPADPLPWPVSREQSLQLLGYFLRHCLPAFGRFQDAMTSQSDYSWSLYHSRLSFALNSKLLSPAEVIEATVAHYQAQAPQIGLAQVEGFIRQLLGWREYIRGVYWRNMPGYGELNTLQAKRPLPDYFWTGETRMHCLQQAIGQSLQFAYAHHIQRLMVTGNFCLLAGIDPEQVDDWYLGIYLDALHWVELPNTRGMSQYADGGLVATKPYAASGNYVQKMSDYCQDCHYRVKEKTGERSCPLNSLYWNFMVRHRDRFQQNQRIGMIYRNWDRMQTAARDEVLARAEWVLANLDTL